MPQARRRTASRVRAETPAKPARAASEWKWLALGPLALIVLLWSCRGALLGTPVADDYSFLHTLTFAHRVDLLGPMGSPLYWRPLSRQLYFMALGPWMIEAPWIVPALHGLLLLALFFVTYRVARRALSPPVAAAAALFPLLGEPTRVLFAWPSGGEYLLAALGAALAVHETLAGRFVTAGLAAAAGMLSHEAGTLVLLLMPILGWARRRQVRDAILWTVLAAGLAALSAAGHAASRARGMSLPSDAYASALSLPPMFQVLRNALVAQLNLEDLGLDVQTGFAFAWVLLLAIILALVARRTVHGELLRARPMLLGSALWFVAGVLPLALLLPDWNGWRTCFPALGLGIALTGLAGLASPALAAVVIALRLTALLLAPRAPTVVMLRAPHTASQFSFVRMARLQRTVESTRRALSTHPGELPRGARILYLGIPNLVLVGFEDSLATRVWARDSTLQWTMFGRVADGRRADAMVEYEGDAAWPAKLVEPEALRYFESGLEAMNSGRYEQSDSLLARAQAEHAWDRGPLLGHVMRNRAVVSLLLGSPSRADSFARASLAIGGENADYWALVARLALLAGAWDRAEQAVQRCLMFSPTHAEGLRLARVLENRPRR